MKKLIILMTFSVFATPLFAQDLIITAFGDTIQCRIIRMDDISVTYQVVRDDGVIGGTTVIARQFVTDFRMERENVENSAEIDNISTTAPTTEAEISVRVTASKTEIMQPAKAKPEHTTLRWAISSGYAKRLSKTELTGDLKGNQNYGALFQKLTNGLTWGSEVQYFFNKNNGLALNVNGVHASAEQKGATNIPKSYRLNYFNLKLRQNIIYVGPAWAHKIETKNFLFSSSLSLGFLIHSEKHWPNGTQVQMDEMRRSVLGGFNCGIGGEYKASSDFAIGIKIGSTFDSVSLFNIGELYFNPILPVSCSNFVVSLYFSFRN